MEAPGARVRDQALITLISPVPITRHGRQWDVVYVIVILSGGNETSERRTSWVGKWPMVLNILAAFIVF